MEVNMQCDWLPIRSAPKVLEANGYSVLRYWNNDILKNIDVVLEDIQRAITGTPTPNPSPQGGGEQSDACGTDSI